MAFSSLKRYNNPRTISEGFRNIYNCGVFKAKESKPVENYCRAMANSSFKRSIHVVIRIIDYLEWL